MKIKQVKLAMQSAKKIQPPSLEGVSYRISCEDLFICCQQEVLPMTCKFAR